jgi:hypothetical protein
VHTRSWSGGIRELASGALAPALALAGILGLASVLVRLAATLSLAAILPLAAILALAGVLGTGSRFVFIIAGSRQGSAANAATEQDSRDRRRQE